MQQSAPLDLRAPPRLTSTLLPPCMISTGALLMGPVHRCCSRSRAWMRPNSTSENGGRPQQGYRQGFQVWVAWHRSMQYTGSGNHTALIWPGWAVAQAHLRTCSSIPGWSRAPPQSCAAFARRSSRTPAARSPSSRSAPCRTRTSTASEPGSDPRSGVTAERQGANGNSRPAAWSRETRQQ